MLAAPSSSVRPGRDEKNPHIMEALLFQNSAERSYRTSLPELKEKEIWVEVKCIVEDPIDWTAVDNMTHEYSHSTHGCDFSGTVAMTGSEVKNEISPGNHVVGFLLNNQISRATHTDPSTNARYVRLESELAWVVPRGTFTHDGAAKARLGRFRYMFGVPK